ETRLQLEPVDTFTPERAYEQRWARTLLANVLQHLAQEYGEEGKARLFSALKNCLIKARAAVPYSALAGQLDLAEGALRVAVHRLRQRYRALLRAEIARTVSNPAEVEEELR